mmetsp:Transcript_10695/g.33864  ORF Transcript_10695/g.33864 Transcript_10695/m.33864 type:complete len:250 (+) Transcript_10695:534-1283(+)
MRSSYMPVSLRSDANAPFGQDGTSCGIAHPLWDVACSNATHRALRFLWRPWVLRHLLCHLRQRLRPQKGNSAEVLHRVAGNLVERPDNIASAPHDAAEEDVCSPCEPVEPVVHLAPAEDVHDPEAEVHDSGGDNQEGVLHGCGHLGLAVLLSDLLSRVRVFLLPRARRLQNLHVDQRRTEEADHEAWHGSSLRTRGLPEGPDLLQNVKHAAIQRHLPFHAATARRHVTLVDLQRPPECGDGKHQEDSER